VVDWELWHWIKEIMIFNWLDVAVRAKNFASETVTAADVRGPDSPAALGRRAEG
jgi:hypothetical protein